MLRRRHQSIRSFSNIASVKQPWPPNTPVDGVSRCSIEGYDDMALPYGPNSGPIHDGDATLQQQLAAAVLHHGHEAAISAGESHELAQHLDRPDHPRRAGNS